ncbi:S-layer homology domain-containing protein [Paenibacillus sp. LHD-38]|uniref:S-layer homology domain-containing protein n=1 Tax=Paenibacillus sp. LHD-38 TaxID=3072143 RepID=UPI00280F536B|nr:S-layer homology domain-containing protein [Paenibacillus sp. LHD-38]MDQ8735148.1 S-layer homology domain-containing protein [Paenibacillus sp. LHD-38]
MYRKILMNSLICTICTMLWMSAASAEKASDFVMKASDKESAKAQFTITLSGENMKDLYAYEVKFKFDPDQLEVVKAESSIKGFSVSPIVKNNEITFAHTKIGNVKGEAGNMDISTITFKAKKAGTAKVNWTSMKIIDQNLKDQSFMLTQSVDFTKIFSDIVGHWAKDDIMQMVNKSIVEGIDNDRFAPNNNVTRAQFAALIARALKLKEGNGKNPFADVKAGSWYEETVKSAYAAGIITGLTSSSFAPDKSITREEMSVMLMRAKAYAAGVKIDSLKTGSLKGFKDEGDISEWAKKSVGFAIASGLLKGRTASSFSPKKFTTRAESAVVIKRLLSGN